MFRARSRRAMTAQTHFVTTHANMRGSKAPDPELEQRYACAHMRAEKIRAAQSVGDTRIEPSLCA